MITTHNLGFPRIGAKRELKTALENYWNQQSSQQQLLDVGAELRRRHWSLQDDLDRVPVGDFSFYDQVLDTSFLLGNIPERVNRTNLDKQTDDVAAAYDLDSYFQVARGRSTNQQECCATPAGEMTKWFDTNYHYIVPELTQDTQFKLNATRLLGEIAEAAHRGSNVKPVIVGPLTYLWLSKARDDSDKLELLDQLVSVYGQLLNELADAGVEWVQLDEPILVTELDSDWQYAMRMTYHRLKSAPLKVLIATYFGELKENLQLLCNLPVAGVHLDAVRAKSEVGRLVNALPAHKIISLGVIDGRNIWKADLSAILAWLEPLAERLQDRLWIAPSCSLLHVPVDLNLEQGIDMEVRSWLAFAVQKLEEVAILAKALSQGRDAVKNELMHNYMANQSRRDSARVHNPQVRAALNNVDAASAQRQNLFEIRAKKQRSRFNLPAYPTTTIGSFPQTKDIRQARLKFRKGQLKHADYTREMQKEIARSVRHQEDLGLDVLVHGEAERNDMVEYFGEQLEGYIFSRFGWVQSYGSRCVKPPILFGDISRPKPMTVDWTKYAQSLTDKPMKGMLTGPVTILNWSFVRDDQSRSDTCAQLALAIRDEVLDLEAAGVAIIQIDEAALREGLPLRRSQWREYLDWAIGSFCIAANGVSDETQIHTHMCYSEFNDIIEHIAKLDADVITIETSRSHMELLEAFDQFNYPNDIGPGVYDIHSPNIPSESEIVSLLQAAAARIPAERLWVNPDCGLKTRQWDEVLPALKNMVSAATALRKQVADGHH